MNVLKKVARKVENSKIVKNPKFLIIGLIVIVVLITLIYFIFLKYSPIMNFKYEGYAISGEELTENLLGENAEGTDATKSSKNIELTKIEEQGTIFKKLNDYFVGNKEKTEINLKYPIYINNNSAIYNLAEDSILISKDFEEIASYPNLSISEGKIYDGNNLERADGKEYIFAKTADNIYINLVELKIKTVANEYTIPVNSILAFTEESIRYYAVNNNVLVFNEINDIDNNSSIQIMENTYTYEELLTRLGIKQEEKNTEPNESQDNIIKEDTTNDNTEENVVEEKPEEEQKPEQEEEQTGYVKPEVKVEDFKAEVYTASSILTIKDPTERIIEAPTFEIYKEGKMYLRRMYSNSGNITVTGLVPETEYEVIGKFTYINENNQKVENTFYEGKITTKGYDALGSIELSKENGEIFSNKIQLTKVKITSDLKAEVIKGINQIELDIGEVRTVLKNNQINELLAGKEITIESSEGLKSDTKINYTIKFYDKNGIELKVNNNTGEARTSKEKPIARVTIKEQDIVSVTLGLKLTNKDNVTLENYKYIVTRPNGDKVQEEKLAENETELVLNDLDQNQYYKIGIYADYDLNDNNGKQEEVELGNLVFATQPISTLGSLELTLENKELTSTSSTISYKIDEERTDKRLIQILNELTINIVENSSDSEEELVYTATLIGEEITNLQQGGTKEIKYDNLKSNTTYTIEITGNVQLGNTQEDIQVTYNYKEFTTLKIPAKVEMRNQFITGNIIDFDVRIEDINNSVLNNTVRMELRNSKNDLIDLQELTTNQDYIRKTYEKLEENQTYKLSFYADQYNEGSTDATYKVNYLIEELELVTEPGISGSIGLTELTRKATGKNLVDISSEIKWYVYPNFNTSDYYGKEYNAETKTLTLGGKSDNRRAVYDLREYAGQEVTMSFKAKAVSGTQTAYIQNSKTDTNRTKIDGLTEERKEFQYTLTVDSTGYLGFYIAGGNGIEVQELQIELGNRKTEYEEFKYTLQSNYSINLEDRRDEITTNDYYIKIYEDEELKKTDRYEEIPEENIITNAIKSYETQTDKQYKAELIIKIRDREYILSELEYSTNEAEEIKGIYTKEDYLEIQPRGKYIILNDLDFSVEGGAKYCFGSTALIFEGEIDYNGKTITMLYGSNMNLFTYIGRAGTINNLVMNVIMPDAVTAHWEDGALFYYNYGEINNIQVNLIHSNPYENTYNTLIGWQNNGIISGFVINYEESLYCQYHACAFYTNYGEIKNGYIYGKNTKQIGQVNEGRTINTTPFVNSNYSSGIISNIYTLVGVEAESSNTNIADLITSNSGTVKNMYSVKVNEQISNRTQILGPNIRSSSGKVENSYYFYNEVFKSSYDISLSNLALYDNEFQSQTLNSEDKFIIEENIKNGFFPSLKMPECMPMQEYLELPNIKDEDLPEIISSNVIEQDNNSAKIELNMHNPTGEALNKIKIEYLTAEIESQEFKEGKSKIIINVKNPERYVSRYNIIEFETKGAYGNTYTKKYEENERIILVDFYREIYTVQDWEQINKLPTENYKLMNDLDFINQSQNVLITNAFSGIIDGANHTIKNINLQSNSGLIKTLNGKLKNLFIDNYNHNVVNSMSSVGIILSSGNNAEINNVHIRNANIKFNINVGISAGFLVGSANGNINNCSVNNAKIEINEELNTLTLGALVGNSNATIRNSYATDISFNINKAVIVNGVGGIAGVSNGIVQYCYTQGDIVTSKSNTGGIVGTNSGIVRNNYSLINIETSAINTAGIVGFNNKSGDGGVTNNLYIGNLYSSGEIANRIVGNNVLGSGNYGYKKQKINGEELSDSSIQLLDDNALFSKNTYENLLFFEGNFDYTELDKNIFPKLYYTENNNLLPNQKDLKLQEALFNIEYIETEKIDSKSGNIAITIDNPQMLNITDITINDMNVKIERNVLENQKNYLEIKVTAEKFYDNYKLSKIIYESDGIKKEELVEKRIELQFFKEITKFEDWQNIDGESAQNYRLLTDIDFSGKLNPNYNVSIGRLEAPEDGYTIKNLDIVASGSVGLIKEAKNSIKNIKFENISITDSSYFTGFTGIIINNTAELKNISFEDITLDSPNKNYVGCVSKNESNNINNISLNNISCNGNTNVAGFIASMGEKNCTDIKGDNIHITGKGDYVGGIFGSISCSNYSSATITKNISVENSEIKGRNYVGGVYGYGRVNNATSNNNIVSGVNYVGGVSGNSYVNSYNVYASDVQVTGSGSNIGGLVGYKNSLWYGRIVDSIVEGTTYNTTNVGGVAGGSAQTFEYIEVNNVKVLNKGNYVGGFIGRTDAGNTSNVIYNYIQDSYVEGNNYIGGLIGCVQTGNVYYNYSDTEIKATGENIGGITGYIKNENTTIMGDNRIEIHNNYVIGSKIKGIRNIGGLIGRTDKELYLDTQFKSNYIEAYIVSDDTDSVSLGIGDRQQENQRLVDNYYYKYSSINGENPNIYNEIFIPANSYLTEADLKNKNTYTSKLKWSTSYINLDTVTENKYPVLKTSYLANQTGIDLPKDSEHIIGNTESLIQTQSIIEQEEPEQTFQYNNKQIQTYSTYSVITAEDGSKTTRNVKLYTKDSKLYAIPSTLNTDYSNNVNIVPIENNLILDSYNGKEYETVLGSDGKLYDLKEPITYPKDFVNENIESIGNNLNNDSHEVEVTYKNGDKIKFNYQTGEVISAIETETGGQTGLFDYLKEKISTIGDTTSGISQELAKQYEESKELQTKLEETSVEEAIEEKNSNSNITNDNVTEETKTTETNNSLKENKYISMYNEETGQYEIYNEEELLDTSKEEVVSENEKIEANNLSEYYASEGETKNTKQGIVWIVISIIGVGIILFILKKNLKKKA